MLELVKEWGLRGLITVVALIVLFGAAVSIFPPLGEAFAKGTCLLFGLNCTATTTPAPIVSTTPPPTPIAAQSSTPIPTPDATPDQTVVTPTPPPTPAGCVLLSYVIWDNDNQGHNAVPQSPFDVGMPGCATLMVTSGHLTTPDGKTCGYDEAQVCVLLHEITDRRVVTVEGTDPGNTWYGVTQGSARAGLEDKLKSGQLLGVNCRGGGCDHATVFTYRDGVLVSVVRVP